MRITNIQLTNFRNYPVLDLAVSQDLVVFSGPNAVGKTNLLESVYFASLFKSFRNDPEFIFLQGADNAKIKVNIEKAGEAHTLEIFLERGNKIYAQFKIDGVLKKRKEAQGFLKVVIFDPADVDLFVKPPEQRRKYLNMVLSQKSRQYLENLAGYKKILLQKNRLLQDIKLGKTGTEELDAWNQQLADLGAQIIFERKEFIGFINQSLTEVYAAISRFHKPVEVFYSALAGADPEAIKQSFLTKLEHLASRELAAGVSLVGPHRDDFSLHSEGLYLAPFSSRGEQRSQVVSLKILELEYLSSGGEKPVLLLDDVLSELDETRREFLLKYLQGRFQTLITTTHPLEMPAQHVALSPAAQAPPL